MALPFFQFYFASFTPLFRLGYYDEILLFSSTLIFIRIHFHRFISGILP